MRDIFKRKLKAVQPIEYSYELKIIYEGDKIKYAIGTRKYLDKELAFRDAERDAHSVNDSGICWFDDGDGVYQGISGEDIVSIKLEIKEIVEEI